MTILKETQNKLCGYWDPDVTLAAQFCNQGH